MKKIITLLLAVISIETLFAEKVQIGDLYYFLDTIHQRATVISLTDTISHYKFTPNTTIHIPDSVSYNHITYSVTYIGWSAFFNCEDLSAITLPDSLQQISPFAFVGCTGLTSIKIPKSVTEIGEGAFAGCTGLTSVEIINKVNEIGGRLFAGCTGLTSVTIGDSVTNIDGDSFDGCIGLTSPVYNAHKFIYMPRFYSGDYTIPDGIESIANYAFSYCTDLTSVTIPNSVTSIGEYAFEYCTGLRSMTCLALTPPITDSDIFHNVDCSDITLYVPAKSVQAYKDAEQWNIFKEILPTSKFKMRRKAK